MDPGWGVGGWGQRAQWVECLPGEYEDLRLVQWHVPVIPVLGAGAETGGSPGLAEPAVSKNQ